ncbi:hypothetical protein ACNFB1_11890 [Pseudomonas sp. NY15349]|uniref:hypothetical protein n=1 Tax=Pseudomonas sp. NY15349 TaxID=3400350 RepID=UPI003A885489
MEDLSNSDIYQAIGSAVVGSQMFERMFVIAARFAIKQSDIYSFEDIVPLKGGGAFKQPVKAILNEISEDLANPELAKRIESLVEDRHKVVHRLAGEYVWPAETTKEEKREIMDLCLRVSSESAALNKIVFDMMIDWICRFPSMGEPLKEALSKLKKVEEK